MWNRMAQDGTTRDSSLCSASQAMNSQSVSWLAVKSTESARKMSCVTLHNEFWKRFCFQLLTPAALATDNILTTVPNSQ